MAKVSAAPEPCFSVTLLGSLPAFWHVVNYVACSKTGCRTLLLSVCPSVGLPLLTALPSRSRPPQQRRGKQSASLVVLFEGGRAEVEGDALDWDPGELFFFPLVL